MPKRHERESFAAVIYLAYHFKLRLCVFLISLSFLLAPLEVLVVSKSPWWNLDPVLLFNSSGIAAVLIWFLLLSLRAGQSWAVRALEVVAVLWVLLTAWMAIRMRSTAIGFFTVFLSAYWFFALQWLRSEVGKSFLDPQMAWYQGQPASVARLTAKFIQKGSEECSSLRVVRLDRDGAFLFSPVSLNLALKRTPGVVELQAGSHHLSVHAVPMSFLSNRSGVGVLFKADTIDDKKKLGDFVEILKGAGNV